MKTKTVHIGDPIKLVRSWMRDLDTKCNEFLHRVEREEDNGTASCRDCRLSGCCYQMVVAHLYEAIPIAQRLRSERLDTPELRERLRVQAESMETLNRTDYMDSAQPCVFLSDRGRCTVYRDRPVACRTYFVFSDPKLCAPPTRGVRDILTLDVHSALAASAEFASNFAYDQLGLKNTEAKIYSGVLPRSVLNVLTAWDADNIVAALRSMHWPSIEELETKINELDEDENQTTEATNHDKD